MDESEKHSDLEIQRLSLIDVSFEDDCLINSSFKSPLHHPFSENQEPKSVNLSEPFEAVEISFNSLEEKEGEPEALESLTIGKMRSGKYNLRKSLAWDNAFFTNEGVLEPEELSSMIGGSEKREKHVLPGIQEDMHRSTDSLSTLDSDSDALTLKSLDIDLFEDIRASIQKSGRVSNVANSNNKKLGVTESQTMRSSEKVDIASRDKMKSKIASKKPSAGTQGSGNATKQISVRSQVSQSVVTNGESTSSPCKPPKVQGRISPISMISTKRASMVANRVKLEKDNSKNASGKGTLASKIPSGGSRNVIPRPTVPSRSSFRSSATTKTELTTSCSSFGSSGSASSDSIGKISLNSMTRKSNSGSSNSSSSSTVKSMSRTTPKGKNVSGSSHLTAYLRSATKRTPSISPASSISEWSTESTTSTSTADQGHKSTRASLDSSSSKGVSADNDAPQVFNSHNSSSDRYLVENDAKVTGSQSEFVKGALTATGSLLCPASSKPSGLRMPSPKIGFFDGARSAVRTPNGSTHSHPAVPSALPKIGAGGISPSGGLNKSKLGKVQPARTALPIRRTRPDAQQTAMTVKPRSPLSHQESLIATTKVSSVSKNVKSPLISPRFRSTMSSKTVGESLLKAEEVGYKGHITTLDSGFSEKNGGSSVLKHKVSPKSDGRSHVLDAEFTPVKGLDASCDLNSTCDAENINPSPKVGKDAICSNNLLMNDLCLLHNSNEKEKTNFEDQVGCLTRQVGAMEINSVVEKKVTLPSQESILAEDKDGIMI